MKKESSTIDRHSLLDGIFSDKSLTPKVKTERISRLLLEKKITPEELIAFAASAKDSPRATCTEALEFASAQIPSLINGRVFAFMVESLTVKAPRIKWEAARVIANTAHLHKDRLGEAIDNLLVNAHHEGTVVRWSAATALGKIYSLNAKQNKALLPLLKKLHKEEEKESIRKIYRQAIDMDSKE
jgi:HEAT repeat protein